MTEKVDLVLSVIRSVGASFPVAASLVNAWNEHSTRAAIEKCQAMIGALAADLDRIGRELEPEESDCAQVFELGLKRCLNDPDHSKATLYSAIVAQFCDGSAPKETALNLIYEAETLLECDLSVLREVRGGRVDSTFGFSEQSGRIAVSKCQASIKKLEGKGLIYRGGENLRSFEREYENSRAWPFTFYEEYYMRSHQGHALIAALQRRAAQQGDATEDASHRG